MRAGGVLGETFGSRAPAVRRRRPSRRDLILDALVLVVSERGFAGASVGAVCARARVSRRAFYDCFDGLDAALVAVMDETLERVGALVSQAFAGEGEWWDGMRRALAAVLAFFDEDPALARVCLVQTLGGGPVVLEQRERVVGAFRALVVAQFEHQVSHASPLAAEGVLASVMGVAHARLIASQPRPLIELLGPLMGIIVGPFMDQAGVAREIERGDRLARELLRSRARGADDAGVAGVAVPAALRDPRAHRARSCLRYVARHPGASNREVGDGIGVSHRGQVAALLGQLCGLGLVSKQAGAPGRPNAWWLTVGGQLVARALEDERRRKRARRSIEIAAGGDRLLGSAH